MHNIARGFHPQEHQQTRELLMSGATNDENLLIACIQHSEETGDEETQEYLANQVHSHPG